MIGHNMRGSLLGSIIQTAGMEFWLHFESPVTDAGEGDWGNILGWGRVSTLRKCGLIQRFRQDPME